MIGTFILCSYHIHIVLKIWYSKSLSRQLLRNIYCLCFLPELKKTSHKSFTFCFSVCLFFSVYWSSTIPLLSAPSFTWPFFYSLERELSSIFKTNLSNSATNSNNYIVRCILYIVKNSNKRFLPVYCFFSEIPKHTP